MGLIIDINHLSPFVKSKLYDFLTFLSFYDVFLSFVKFMKRLSEADWKNPSKNVYRQREALITIGQSLF
jgi:hypothetical protein